MNRKLPLKVAALVLACSMAWVQASAQGCTNTSQYPGDTILPDPLGAVTPISTCSYFQEYSAVGPVVAGGNYEFTVTANGYITVHEGTPTGPVIAQGVSPVVATATAAGTLFAHWNVDANCATSTGCQTTNVQFLLNCVPPTVTVTPVDDCANNQFSLTVNVTSLGDGTSVSMIYSVDGGADITLSELPTGTYNLGPFTVGSLVNLTVAHSSDPLCNRVFTGLQSANTCPTIINCGGAPLAQTYCYINNDNNHWHYQASAVFPLILIFSSGQIESNSYDHLKIYDGPDNTGTLLWENPTGTTDLTGLQVIAPSGEIYMQNSSDGSVSCQTNSGWTWNWQVGCLDCTPATATYTVNTDCTNMNYTVDVNITNLGSDPTLGITNNGGAATVTATSAGVYTVGPFPANVPVVITLENSDNPLCNMHSASLVNPLCPVIIQCGTPALTDSYCYGLNDTHAWHWQAATPGDSLSLRFISGSIQAAFTGSGDHLRIYDGPNNTSPLLFDHTQTNTVNLADLQVTSTGPDIYMEMTSDGFGSCSDGSTIGWNWMVGCADCSAPVATYSVATDCSNMTYLVAVNITSLGSDPVLDIINNGGALPVAATAPGVYSVGPFPAGDTTVITLLNDVNALCSVHSPALVNPLCPTVLQCDSAPAAQTYCYINNDNHEWHWQSSAGQPLAMQFTAGTIESSNYDRITIYNGPDANSPVLFTNPVGVTTTLTGQLIISTGPDLYMTVTSDGSVSCQSGSMNTWLWSIGCLDCTNPAASYTVVEDCIHHAFSVAVNVDSTGSSPVVRIANSLNTDTLANVPAGITMVGPFPMDSTVTLTVLNQTNNLCRVFSPAFTASSNNCVDSVCTNGYEALAYEYCYTNNDTAWFLYQGGGTSPLTIHFLWGQLLAGDFVQVFNGSTPTPANLLWQGNLNGNMSGFAINTTNPQQKMLMRVVSNAAGSCSTGQASLPLHWVVACGAVGVNELASTTFSMYPNPTTGDLMLRLPAEARGPVDLRIVDLAGRIVRHERFVASGSVNSFDLKDLQGGNYTVTITTNDWVNSQRLQIVH